MINKVLLSCNQNFKKVGNGTAFLHSHILVSFKIIYQTGLSLEPAHHHTALVASMA